jgi:hypothetical protein
LPLKLQIKLPIWNEDGNEFAPYWVAAADRWQPPVFPVEKSVGKWVCSVGLIGVRYHTFKIFVPDNCCKLLISLVQEGVAK